LSDTGLPARRVTNSQMRRAWTRIDNRVAPERRRLGPKVAKEKGSKGGGDAAAPAWHLDGAVASHV
jgi:hypothetical protein